MNLVLTGFMGVGKSVTGKVLSEKLSRDFFDTDTLIEQKIGLSVDMIFEKFGEQKFRQIESEIIKTISQEDAGIISCGGGAVLNPANVEILGKKGIIINLYASPEAIYGRIKTDSTRPLLKCENPLDEIKRLLELRRSIYSDCDYAFNTDGLTPPQVASNILDVVIVEKKGKVLSVDISKETTKQVLMRKNRHKFAKYPTVTTTPYKKLKGLLKKRWKIKKDKKD